MEHITRQVIKAMTCLLSANLQHCVAAQGKHFPGGKPSMSKSVTISDVLWATSLDTSCRRQCQRLMGQVLPHRIRPGDVAERQHPSCHQQNQQPNPTDPAGNGTFHQSSPSCNSKNPWSCCNGPSLTSQHPMSISLIILSSRTPQCVDI